MRKLLYAVPIALCAIAITAEASKKNDATKKKAAQESQSAVTSVVEAPVDAAFSVDGIVTSEAEAKKSASRTANHVPATNQTRGQAYADLIVADAGTPIASIFKAAPAQSITAKLRLLLAKRT